MLHLRIFRVESRSCQYHIFSCSINYESFKKQWYIIIIEIIIIILIEIIIIIMVNFIVIIWDFILVKISRHDVLFLMGYVCKYSNEACKNILGLKSHKCSREHSLRNEELAFCYEIVIIIIIMSCRQHGYPWTSLATSPYHSSPPAGLQGYILCLHIVAVCKFVLVVLLLHIHMWGSIGVHRLWARPCFFSSVPRVWFV